MSQPRLTREQLERADTFDAAIVNAVEIMGLLLSDGYSPDELHRAVDHAAEECGVSVQ